MVRHGLDDLVNHCSSSGQFRDPKEPWDPGYCKRCVRQHWSPRSSRCGPATAVTGQLPDTPKQRFPSTSTSGSQVLRLTQVVAAATSPRSNRVCPTAAVVSESIGFLFSAHVLGAGIREGKPSVRGERGGRGMRGVIKVTTVTMSTQPEQTVLCNIYIYIYIYPKG